jgi:hypothetical protein
MTTRRHLIQGGLSALGLMACKAPPAPVWLSSVDGPIRIGWRLIPGDPLHYTTTLTRSVGSLSQRKEEFWEYLPMELDENNQTAIRGRRLKPTAPSQQILFRLGLSGSLHTTDVKDFSAHLPHSLLGLTLPSEPVSVGESWKDPELLTPFTSPLNFSVSEDSTATLLEVNRRNDTTLAAIQSRAILKKGRQSIRLDGLTLWDTINGIIAQRSVEARFLPMGRNPQLNPGVLQMTMTHVPPGVKK